MKYKINIEKCLENPKYQEEVEKYEKISTYTRNYNDPTPKEFIYVKALEVELTDEQFEVVKKAVLEVF